MIENRKSISEFFETEKAKQKLYFWVIENRKSISEFFETEKAKQKLYFWVSLTLFSSNLPLSIAPMCGIQLLTS
ncbi:hypothetical protein L1987_82520 [Smallanthus sonchifolius]|uniref:Uncharacterized protein n=1 Tax=Smallanthus sonchifolius TaxID=185202 RepID=A0ACB8YBA6_9ASTR|nr:hypothetical protein L1987_82520 [Smallanthus sonchifolius]